MKRIVLIHTVPKLAMEFKQDLAAYLAEEVKIYNIWDDFLAIDPNETGSFSIDNHNRLFYDLRSAELTGADLIVVTCSTLTPAIEKLRPFFKLPIIAIDDALGQLAATQYQQILVLATAGSAAIATAAKLEAEATLAGRQITVDTKVVAEAFAALKLMEMERHDALVMAAAGACQGYDCIVLAQASMAHLAEAILQAAGIPVLASPKLCMAQIKETLKEIKK